MAQVLAPIVQTSGSMTMLHSSADAFQTSSAPQPHHHQSRSAQMQRSPNFNTQNGGAGYRGASAPIATYAFSATPQLRQESSKPTSVPSPSNPTLSTVRLGHATHTSSESGSTTSTSGSSSRSGPSSQHMSKEDTATSHPDSRRTTVDNFSGVTFSPAVPDLSLSLSDAPAKSHPDRYRRGTRRTDSSNSGTASSSTSTPIQQSPQVGAPTTAGALKSNNGQSFSGGDIQIPVRPGHHRASSVDDMQLPRQMPADQAKRYRRRSLSGLEVATQTANPAPIDPVLSAPFNPSAKRTTQEFRPASSHSRHGSRPNSSHERQGSAGSTSSATSVRPSSSRQEPKAVRPSTAGSSAPTARVVPESTKRVMTPSPLSHPISPSEPSPAKPHQPSPSSASPAVQHLTALNDKDAGRGMKSRLRRAFSFGSAAELRRASAENNLSAERAKLRKDKYQDDNDPEQAAIVAKQEAAGIGAGIYSGQGGFTGSTDNLSISSTASSASIMLRKMGSGMKKGGRSIKGLFRPKSVIGVPAADGPIIQPSVAQVSRVTVEAERQKVNVNVDPHEQVGGGTGYPRLERNSIDASRTTSELNISPNHSMSESGSRKSIVGGDRERAEVLSNIKRGILKRTGTNSDSSSPVVRPVDLSHGTETPKSSAPSTPNDDNARPVQVHIKGEDYFGRPPPRLSNPSTRSLPTTPQGGNKNISFSPRLQFHDAWSSADYDRRGEIATCNRLTPMLAQQIKEELNSFKMEMEVHELSKPHTHFF